MNPRRILLSSLTLLCLVGLAACGGDDSKTTSATDGATKTTVASGSASATTAGGSASGGATTTIDFKGSGSSSLCDYGKDIESNSALTDAFSGKTDAKGLKDGFTKTLDVINTAVSKAPSEIKADLQTLQAGFKQIAAFYASYDYDITKLTAAMKADPTLVTKIDALNSDAYSAASDRVDAYFAQVCGIKSN
jgi:hypothetical protein